MIRKINGKGKFKIDKKYVRKIRKLEKIMMKEAIHKLHWDMARIEFLGIIKHHSIKVGRGK